MLTSCTPNTKRKPTVTTLSPAHVKFQSLISDRWHENTLFFFIYSLVGENDQWCVELTWDHRKVTKRHTFYQFRYAYCQDASKKWQIKSNQTQPFVLATRKHCPLLKISTWCKDYWQLQRHRRFLPTDDFTIWTTVCDFLIFFFTISTLTY